MDDYSISLAEPKFKSKWTLNPRGNIWANDDNKFGQKMLEKMGWSKGKGLGLKEDGTTEHIKVSCNSMKRGLGFEGNPDTVLPLCQEYEALLSNLKPTSLEGNEATVPKKIKIRHRYGKIFKAKDVSSYSPTDLAQIFSKTAKESQVGAVTLKSVRKLDQSLEERAPFIVTPDAIVEHEPPTKRKRKSLGILTTNNNESAMTKQKKKVRFALENEEATITSTLSTEEEITVSADQVTDDTQATTCDYATVETSESHDSLGESAKGLDEKVIAPEKLVTKKKGKKRISGGYNLNNPRIVEIVSRRDELAKRIESNVALSTSNLLNIKGYGRGIKQ